MSKNRIGKCRYCGNQVLWINNKPYNAKDDRHWCDKYPTPKVVEVQRVVDPSDIRDLREEIAELRARVERLLAPKVEPQNPLEKRVARLESIVVEIRKS